METTGGDGGTSSDWQVSATYIDTGLSPDTLYTYTAQIRDANGLEGIASAGASATTDAVDANFIQRNNRIINMLLRGGL